MHDPDGIAFRRAVGASLAVPLRRDVSGASEDELARRVGRGDEDAFAELCRRRATHHHALCRCILRNSDDAHDAVQGATEKALAALRRGQLRGDVRPWLSCICRNEALSLLRVRAPWSELDDGRAAGGPSPEATVLMRERLAGVAEDLAELPERQRRAIVLREVAELPYDHVARRLGMRQDAARQAVREARSALRDGAEGRDATCDAVRLQLADGDGRRRRGRRVRSHLRVCAPCRTWEAARREPVGVRSVLPGLWAALPGLWSWVPSAPALLAPGAGGGAFSGAVQAVAVAVAVALPVAVPSGDDRSGDPGGAGPAVARVRSAAGDAASRASRRAGGGASPVGAAGAVGTLRATGMTPGVALRRAATSVRTGDDGTPRSTERRSTAGSTTEDGPGMRAGGSGSSGDEGAAARDRAGAGDRAATGRGGARDGGTPGRAPGVGRDGGGDASDDGGRVGGGSGRTSGDGTRTSGTGSRAQDRDPGAGTGAGASGFASPGAGGATADAGSARAGGGDAGTARVATTGSGDRGTTTGDASGGPQRSARLSRAPAGAVTASTDGRGTSGSDAGRATTASATGDGGPRPTADAGD